MNLYSAGAPLQEGISLVLIVYNEEQLIERCLESVQGKVDEIIVLHDGPCHDRTLEIARQYTDKVFVGEHTGYAELHHIEVLPHITRSWLLKLDADEYLSGELREGLRSLADDPVTDAYAFIWPYWDGQRYITRKVPYKPALFRMSRIAAIEFTARNYSTTGVMKNIPLLLEHRPQYNNYTRQTFERKWKKWIKIQAQMTLDHQDTRFYNFSDERIGEFRRYMDRQIRMAHPLLAPGWFVFSWLKFMVRLQVWRNPAALHVPYYMGLYAYVLCRDIWDGKRRQAGKRP